MTSAAKQRQGVNVSLTHDLSGGPFCQISGAFIPLFGGSIRCACQQSPSNQTLGRVPPKAWEAHQRRRQGTFIECSISVGAFVRLLSDEITVVCRVRHELSSCPPRLTQRPRRVIDDQQGTQDARTCQEQEQQRGHKPCVGARLQRQQRLWLCATGAAFNREM